MTIFQSYLANARIKKVLNKQPGEEGFSLIELVVVVAVLAILAAVAIPNFLSVSKDGQIAAAKNTLATVIKECAAMDVKGNGTEIQNVKSALANLNGYELQTPAGGAIVGSADSCYGVKAVDATGVLPELEIGFAIATGATTKTCELSAGANAYDPGIGSCDESKNGDGAGW